MGVIKDFIAEQVIYGVAEQVADSKPVQAISDGFHRRMMKIADAIEEKDKQKIIEAAAEYSGMNVLCAYMDSIETQYKQSILTKKTEYTWQKYEYSVFTIDEEEFYRVYINRMNCTVKDLNNPNWTIHVKCNDKKISRIKEFEISDSTRVLDTVRCRSHFIDPKITNALSGRRSKPLNEYLFDNSDWIIKEYGSPRRCEIESASVGKIACIKYLNDGIVLGCNDTKIMLNVLVSAFIPLIEEMSCINKEDN